MYKIINLKNLAEKIFTEENLILAFLRIKKKFVLKNSAILSYVSAIKTCKKNARNIKNMKNYTIEKSTEKNLILAFL